MICKNPKTTLRNTTDVSEKNLKNRLKFLKEHIKNKIKVGWGNWIKQVAESITIIILIMVKKYEI